MLVMPTALLSEDTIPTLMPSKEEVVPIPVSKFGRMLMGTGLTAPQQAAREIMRTMAFKFFMLHGPILGVSILLNITSLIITPKHHPPL